MGLDEYKLLVEEMQEIAKIIRDFPPELQTRVFEVLVSTLLDKPFPISNNETPTQAFKSSQPDTPVSSPVQQNVTSDTTNNENQDVPVSTNRVPLNAQLRVFMRRYSVTEEELNNIIHYESNDDGLGVVHLIQKPNYNDQPISQSQIHLALLVALENCINKADFTVDAEKVRNVCKDEGTYSPNNFYANFSNNNTYFKDVPTSQYPNQALSDTGQAELAKLIKSLIV